MSTSTHYDYIQVLKMWADLKPNRQIQMRYIHSFGMDIKMVANAAMQDTNTF